MRIRIGSIALTTSALVLLVSGTAGARTVVPIKGIEFRKPFVQVNRGEAVLWKDKDGFVSHTVTSRGNKRFHSSQYLQKGDSHRVRFTQRGSYRYVCRIHPNMRGRIRVG